MRVTSAIRIAMLVLVAALGCRHKRAGATTDVDAAPPSGSTLVDALGEAEAELAANAAALNALGVQIAWGRRDKLDSDDETGRTTAVPSEGPTADPGEPSKRMPATNSKKPTIVRSESEPKRDGDNLKRSESTPCQRICTLAGVACDLSKRICQLADDHQGDARYANACWNAGQQCEDASDACTDCTAC